MAITKKVQKSRDQPSGLAYQPWERGGRRTALTQFRYYGFVMFTDLELRRPEHPELIPEEIAALYYF